MALRRAVPQWLGLGQAFAEFPGSQRLFIPDERWKTEARRHYARLQMPVKAGNFLTAAGRVRAGVDAVAAAVRTGTLAGG